MRHRTTVILTTSVITAALAGGTVLSAQANGFPAVKELKLTAVTDTTMTITWRGNNYPSASNRYRVSWVEQESPSRSWASTGADYGQSSSPLKLTGLKAAHHYTVSVAARDSTGWFGPAVSFDARTLG